MNWNTLNGILIADCGQNTQFKIVTIPARLDADDNKVPVWYHPTLWINKKRIAQPTQDATDWAGHKTIDDAKEWCECIIQALGGCKNT